MSKTATILQFAVTQVITSGLVFFALLFALLTLAPIAERNPTMFTTLWMVFGAFVAGQYLWNMIQLGAKVK